MKKQPRHRTAPVLPDYQYKPSAQFNTTISDWQCVSVPIVLKYTDGESGKTYTPTSIRIILKYKNQENTAWFDKIMLVKDVASSYTYDKDGNLIRECTGDDIAQGTVPCVRLRNTKNT